MSRTIEPAEGRVLFLDVVDDTGMVIAVAGRRVDRATLNLARLAGVEDRLMRAVFEASDAAHWAIMAGDAPTVGAGSARG